MLGLGVALWPAGSTQDVIKGGTNDVWGGPWGTHHELRAPEPPFGWAEGADLGLSL